MSGIALFSIPIFFITLREAIEASIIVSVLLAVISKLSVDQEQQRQLSWKVWIGTASGGALSLLIGAAFLIVWYKYAINLWVNAEKLWEGIFGTIAGVMVAMTAFAMLKGSKMHEKYKRKLEEKLECSTDDQATYQTMNDYTEINQVENKEPPKKLNASEALVKGLFLASFCYCAT